MPKAKNEASAIVTLDGVQKSVAMYTKRIDHPDGEVYKSGENKGTVKSITQYFRDAKHTKCIADGYSDDVKIETLTHKGKVLRWVKEDLTDDELAAISVYRGRNTLNKIANEMVKLHKRMINLSKNGTATLQEEDTAKVLTFCDSRFAEGLRALDMASKGEKKSKKKNQTVDLFA